MERLRSAGHEAAASALDRWRNRDGKGGGWDGWFSRAYPQHYALAGLGSVHAGGSRPSARPAGRGLTAANLRRIPATCIAGAPWPNPPDLVVHADWSTAAGRKRQVARALLRDGRYWVTSPRPACRELLEWLAAKARAGLAVLAGFDFAIGVPVAYARAAKSAAGLDGVDLGESFLDMVRRLPPEFFVPQNDPSRVTWKQPFFPATNAGWNGLRSEARGAKLDGVARRILGDSRAVHADLLRKADRATPHRQAASALFLLTGGAQVGKASIAGLREILLPALEKHRQAVRVWPYEGPLPALIRPGIVTLAETYPAESLRHLGVGNSAKRDQGWRREAGEAIAAQASSRGIVFTARLRAAIKEGFGAAPEGEDPFDATVGAVHLALLALGHDTVQEPIDPEERAWEGSVVGCR